MDLLGTWGKRTQDWLGGVKRDLLGDDLPPDEKRAATVGTMGPSLASQMQGLDTAQRQALAGGGVPALMRDPAVATQATDLAGQLDLLGPIKAYHGTPHTFLPEPEHPMGRFRMDKLGTGEGAQAYGHGLYFAESPEVARGYRENLSAGERRLSFGKRSISDADGIETLNPKELAAVITANKGGDVQKAILDQEELLKFTPGGYAKTAREQALAALKSNPKRYAGLKWNEGGSLYEVELGLEHEDLLDWDLPLSKQPPKVREAVGKLGVEPDAKSMRYDDDVGAFNNAPMRGQDLLDRLTRERGDRAAASMAMRKAGIPGIRYLDAGSRGGEGTRNVVLFDDALARIQGRR